MASSTVSRKKLAKPPNITFQLATKEHAEEVAKVINRAYDIKNKNISKDQAYRLDEEKGGQRTSTAAMLKRIEDAAQYAVGIALKNSQLVSTASIQRHNKQSNDGKTTITYAELFLLAVHPDFWQQGLGAQMIDYASIQAKEKFNATEVRIEVLKCALGLLKYYTDLGFQFMTCKDPSSDKEIIDVHTVKSPTFVRGEEEAYTMRRRIS